MVQGALAGLERIFEVLSLPENLKGCTSVSPSVESEDVLVEINKVTFGYMDGQPVLTDVDLKIESGTHVAIVDRTGAGKSSLFHLVGGLYLPWKGTIRLQGKAPDRIPPAERRRI